VYDQCVTGASMHDGAVHTARRGERGTMMRATSRIAVLMLPALVACSRSARLPASSAPSPQPAPTTTTRPDASQPVTAPRAADRCLLLSPPVATHRADGAPADTILIVVTDPLDSAEIDHPRNAGERLVASAIHGSTQPVSCDAGVASIALEGDDTATTRATWTGASVALDPAPGDDRPHLVVRRATPRGARDLLDAGAAAVVTADPATIAYAATRPDLVAVPLPWDRVYVLATPFDSTGAPGDAEQSWTVGDRSSLAADAVRVDARAAGDQYWWVDQPSCTPPDTATGAADAAAAAPPALTTPRRSLLTGQHRLGYPRDDDVARALAGRLVALRARHDPSAQAIGLAAVDLPAALADGRVGAAVVALPRRVAAACDAQARWRARSTSAPGPRWSPLIETRPRALVRRDRVGLSLDADDALHILPPGGTP
jgi:hypothetical protein